MLEDTEPKTLPILVNKHMDRVTFTRTFRWYIPFYDIAEIHRLDFFEDQYLFYCEPTVQSRYGEICTYSPNHSYFMVAFYCRPFNAITAENGHVQNLSSPLYLKPPNRDKAAANAWECVVRAWRIPALLVSNPTPWWRRGSATSGRGRAGSPPASGMSAVVARKISLWAVSRMKE
jgi:hypothetical protein